MRIAVVTSSPPRAEGGHMVIARELTRALGDAGHEAHLVVTPQNPWDQTSAYWKTWRTDVRTIDGAPIDQVISTRFPSYAVRHPRHVCWLNHTMREYYDLWERFSSRISWKGRVKEGARRAAIHAVDRYLLTRNVTKVFAQSETIRNRYTMWPGFHAEVLYPPAPQRPYRCDGYGPELLFVSRLTPLKRADLFLRALAAPAAAGIRAVIAGDGEERAALGRLADELGLSARVRFAGPASDADLVEHLASCRAVVFPPLQEDYGFVTIEAFAARKAVITCRDSGGPVELVRDSVTGFVCDPTPESLAAAMRRVADDAGLARRLGQAAHEVSARLSWREAVRRLVLQ